MAHGIIHSIRHAIVHGIKHLGASVLGASATLFIAQIGDSNNVGIGIGDAADTGFGVLSPNTGVLFNAHYANGVGPPPTFIDFPGNQVVGSLGLYAASNVADMGTEITTGSTLQTATAVPFIAKMGVSGATLAVEWLPTGTYPAAGAGNLFNLWVARMHQLEGLVNRHLDGVIVHLGTNDALDNTQATAFATNMTALATAIRVAFGGSTKIAWVKTNSNTGNTFTTTVRTGQVTAAAGDPQMALVVNDDLPLLGDLLHFTTSSYLTLGQRLGFAILDLLGFARQSVVTSPRILGFGPGALGAGNLLPVSWGGARAGDIEYLAVVTGIVAGTIPTPAGWTAVASTTSAASGVTEQYAVFSRVIDAPMLAANNGWTAPTTVAPVTTARHAAKLFTVRGPNVNPTTDAAAVSAPNTFDTGPTTMGAVTSTATNDLVILFTGGYCGSSGTMTGTNGTLTGFAEIQDGVYVIVTDRELIAVYAGTLAGIGSSGTFSISSSANMVKLGIAVAVKP